jgi:predicted transcriptional regulator
MTERRTLADYMTTRLITLPPEMEINRAAQVLLQHRISGAPVVDAAGLPIGVLSKKDCLRAALHATYHHELGGTVADYMSREVETMEADLDLVTACERFLASDYRRFPVMREGRLVGQISRADLLRALAEQWR